MHDTTTDGEYYMQLDDVLDSEGNSIADTYGVSLSNLVSMGASGSVNVSEAFSPTTTKDATTGTSTGVTFSATAPAAYTVTYYKADGSIDTTLGTNAGTGTSTITLAQINTDLASAASITSNLTQLQLVFGTGFTAANTAATVSATTGIATVTAKTINGGIVKYNTDTGAFVSVNGDTKSIKLDFKDSYTSASGTKSLGNFSDITVNMTKSTLYNNNGTSTIGATSGDLDGLNAGRKLGALSGIAIQNDGMIYASYDSGQSRLLGQIAVASFANASGLAKEGDNLYSATLNSGTFDGIGTDISSNGDYMSTGVLEMSNVDLSTEFTEMITTQRGFQACSRIITVSDTMLEELVNLKR